MCNAWNHPPGCSCGWGGDGHLGRRTSFDHSPSHLSTHVFESYVNHNAHCPVCGAHVYFYQSPDGGRVFFDALGPPWPKHPCTDHGSEIHYLQQYLEFPEKENKRLTAPDGWTVFICDAINAIGETRIYKLTGLMDGQKCTLYTRQAGLTTRAPYFIRVIGPDSFQISTYQTRFSVFGSYEFEATKFQSQLAPLMTQGAKPKIRFIPKRSKSSPLPRQDTKKSNQSVQTVTSKSSPQQRPFREQKGVELGSLGPRSLKALMDLKLKLERKQN